VGVESGGNGAKRRVGQAENGDNISIEHGAPTPGGTCASRWAQRHSTDGHDGDALARSASWVADWRAAVLGAAGMITEEELLRLRQYTSWFLYTRLLQENCVSFSSSCGRISMAVLIMYSALLAYIAQYVASNNGAAEGESGSADVTRLPAMTTFATSAGGDNGVKRATHMCALALSSACQQGFYGAHLRRMAGARSKGAACRVA